MDSQKKKLIIIGGIIGVVVVAIIIILILILNSATPQEPVQSQPQEEVENTEVSLEEIQEIKDYLKRYAYVIILARDSSKPNITHETMSSNLAMVYMATKNIEKGTSQNADTTATEDVSNTDTDNRLSMDIGATNTVENTVSTDFPTAPKNTNVFGLPEEEIQKAIFEMFGNEIDNLTQILMTETTERELSEVYIKNIQDITCSNGIYNVRFDACLETPEQQKLGTNVYGLDAYTIQVKLEKNEEPKYNEYQLQTNNVVSEITPMAYHISYSNGKYGVIDNNGNVILDNKYTNVSIPNSYVGLFMCYDELGVPTFMNERGVQQFKDYKDAKLLEATGSEGIKWNENDIIIVENEELYGAVNYMGTTIFDVKYDKIEPLGYFPGFIVLTKDGNKALADTKGNILSDFDYSKIGIGGIEGMDANAILTPAKTQEEATKLLSENDYIIGLSTSGIYTNLETMPKEPHMIMSPYAKEYTMTIGTSWQLAVGTDGITPVYMRTQPATQQAEPTGQTQETVQ